MTLLFIICVFCTPAALLWLSKHQAWAAKLGIVALCYSAGLVLGNTGLLSASLGSVQQTVSDVMILLALPLLLFTLDIGRWRGGVGKALLSMLFATTAVVATATCLFLLLRQEDGSSAAHFAAMSVAVYTGGTPNLAAIKAGLDIPHSEYIVFHSLDTVVGGLYLLFMLTLGVRVFRRLLAPAQLSATSSTKRPVVYASQQDDYAPLLQASNIPSLLKLLVLAVVVAASSLGVAELHANIFQVDSSPAIVIVALTGISIALSLLPAVRKLALSYTLGMYLIYVFCFVVASMASIGQLADVDVGIVLFLLGTVLGSLFLHALLCALARVDADTFMVTSVAAVCSPPFVPMMARVLDNPSALLSGMTAGILGYALGNFLGISLGLFLQGG